jgi:DNA invertase Pin-like site-specific DNA recombinase
MNREQPRVAVYTRVSTQKQSIDSQILDLRSYCERRQWSNVAEFSDVISGSNFTRTGLDRLMREVRAGRIDILVCSKLDRIGRSLPHLAQICAELTANKCALVCASQSIDTSNDNPAGRLQLGVLMAVAEFERSLIRERVLAGLNAARARGAKLGRRETLSQHRERVLELLKQGLGVRAIARKLKLPVASAHKLVRSLTVPCAPVGS